MYTPDQLRDMPGHQFAELLEPMSRRDLKDLLVYLQGYSPEGVAGALNSSEKIAADTAGSMARSGRAAADEVAAS